MLRNSSAVASAGSSPLPLRSEWRQYLFQSRAVFVALTLAAAPGWCAEQESEYMMLNGKSWHLDAPGKYNEQNFGAGYQHLVRNGAISAGWNWSLFQDSYNRPSGYVGYAWQYRLIDKELYVDAGAMAFLMTRADVFNSLPFPALLPYVAVGNRKYFANLTLIPGWRESKGIVFLQLGMPLKNNGLVSGALLQNSERQMQVLR